MENKGNMTSSRRVFNGQPRISVAQFSALPPPVCPVAFFPLLFFPLPYFPVAQFFVAVFCITLSSFYLIYNILA